MRKRTRVMCGLLSGALLLGSCLAFAACREEDDEVLAEISSITDFDERYINLYGRNYYNEDIGGMAFVNGASGFEVKMRGTALTATVKGVGDWNSMFSVFVDGEEDSNARIVTAYTAAEDALVLAENLAEGEHTVKVLKRTDSFRSTAIVKELNTDGVFLGAPEKPALKLEVYGDSITNGSGILREVTYDEATGKYSDSNLYTAETQNALQAYAAVAARKLDAELRIFGRGGITLKYSAGDSVSSNYNSVAVDLPASEYPYDYNSWTPDAVVIYLGTNDYNIGTANPTLGFSIDGMKIAVVEFVRNVIGLYYGKNIPIVLCSGMMVHNVGLNTAMAGAKNMLISEYPNVDVLDFDACAIGHPVVGENAKAGDQLAAKLKNLLGI